MNEAYCLNFTCLIFLGYLKEAYPYEMLACDIGTFKANIQGNYERRSLVLYIEMIVSPDIMRNLPGKKTSCDTHMKHLIFNFFVISSTVSVLILSCSVKLSRIMRSDSEVRVFSNLTGYICFFVTPIPNQRYSLAASLTGCFCWPNCSARWTF